MKKTLTDNDPRLTAYALGELSKDEVEEVSSLLDASQNRSLKAEVESIDSLSVMLTQTLAPKAAVENDYYKLSASHRDAIYRSAKAPTANDVSSTKQSAWFRPVAAIMGAAAIVTISFIALDNVDSNEDVVANTPEVSFSGLSEDVFQPPIMPSNESWGRPSYTSSVNGYGGGDYELKEGIGIDESPSLLNTLVERNWVNRAEEATTRVPLVCGKASWKSIQQSIEKDSELPNKNAIRVEEILNHFHYAVSADLNLNFVKSGVELVQCPWNNENLIAVVLVENIHTDSIEIETAITFSESVLKYRLVGYSSALDSSQNIIAPVKVIMESAGQQIIMYEIEAASELKNAVDILSLDVRATIKEEGELIKDEKTLVVQYSDRDWTKAVQDVQFALILAHWSQLISESDPSISAQKKMVLSMLDEFSESHTLTSEQEGALKVLRSGLDLHQD